MVFVTEEPHYQSQFLDLSGFGAIMLQNNIKNLSGMEASVFTFVALLFGCGADTDRTEWSQAGYEASMML